MTIMIKVQHTMLVAELASTHGSDDAPVEDKHWIDHQCYYLAQDGSDQEWIHRTIKNLKRMVGEHEKRWWRAVITEDKTIKTNAGEVSLGKTTHVLLGPYCLSKGVPMPEVVKSDSGYYELPFNLPDHMTGSEVEQRDGVPMLGEAADKPGEEVVEEEDGVEQSVFVTDEDGDSETGTITASDIIPSGTAVTARDELGREYTVTVL